MSQEITEIRGIINRILLQETKDLNNPADWGLKSSFTKDGVLYQFTTVEPLVRGRAPSVTYYKSNEKTSAAIGPETMLLSAVPQEGRTASAPAAKAAPAPTGPGSSTTTARRAASTPKPKSETGYARLNTVLRDLSAALGTTITANIVFGGTAYTSSKIPKITDSDNLSVSTVAYLYDVSGDLQTRINAKKDGILNRLINAFGLGSGKNLDQIYNNDNWTSMRNSLLGNSPAPVSAATRTYLESLPAGELGVDRATIDGFANYLVKLAAALDVTVPGAESSAASGASASSTGTSVASSVEDAISDIASSSLADFLKLYANVYGGNEQNNVNANLEKYADHVLARIANAEVKNFNTQFDKIEPEIKKIKRGWDGAEIAGETFTSDDSGLIAFLRFAHVATHPASTTGYDAATEIGLDPAYSGYFPTNPAWLAACRLAAISSFPMVAVFFPPEGVNAGDKLDFNTGTALEETPGFRYTFQKRRSGGSGTLLSAGFDENDNGQAGGGTQFTVANIHGESAKKILQSLGGPVTFSLRVGKRRYETTVNNFNIGSTVDFSSARLVEKEPPTAAEIANTGASASVLTRGGTDESRIVTEDGNRSIPLENVYVDPAGTARLNPVNVSLEKEVRRKFDSFTLEVADIDRAILVPIIVRTTPGMLQETNGETVHWALTVADASVEPGDTGLRYIPMRKIEWQYDGNYFKYGANTSPRIRLVAGVVASPPPPGVPKGIKLITEDEALELGTSVGEFDPIEAAIIKYVTSSDNPVGVALYLTRNLNSAMNSFPKLVYSAR